LIFSCISFSILLLFSRFINLYASKSSFIVIPKIFDLSVFTEISKILGITINELLEEERLIKRKNSNSIEIEIKLEINYKIYEYISEHLLEVGVANNIIHFAKIKIFTFCEVNAIIYLRVRQFGV